MLINDDDDLRMEGCNLHPSEEIPAVCMVWFAGWKVLGVSLASGRVRMSASA